MSFILVKSTLIQRKYKTRPLVCWLPVSAQFDIKRKNKPMSMENGSTMVLGKMNIPIEKWNKANEK